MECTFTHVSFDGITTVVPANCISIDDELPFFDNNPKKLARAKSIIGFNTRHVVTPGTTSVDLCEAAARQLTAGMGIDMQRIDTLILVNQSPDHFFPSGACLLHGRLGLPKSCAAFDVALGCSGYVYGLWLAHSLIASGASKKLLLLAGDTPSLHSTPQNRLTNPLFGDAGTATLLSRSSKEYPASFVLGSDGSGWNHIVMPGGGFRLPPTPEMLQTPHSDEAGNTWKLNELLMDGMAVFNFTMQEVPGQVRKVLEQAGANLDSMDFFAFHQANKQIVDTIARDLGLAPEAAYSKTFSRYGNQSTASVPCVLCDALQNDMPGRSMQVLLSAFGVGLSFANAVITCDHSFNGGVQYYEPLADAPGREEQEAFWINAFLKKGHTS